MVFESSAINKMYARDVTPATCDITACRPQRRTPTPPSASPRRPGVRATTRPRARVASVAMQRAPTERLCEDKLADPPPALAPPEDSVASRPHLAPPRCVAPSEPDLPPPERAPPEVDVVPPQSVAQPEPSTFADYHLAVGRRRGAAGRGPPMLAAPAEPSVPPPESASEAEQPPAEDRLASVAGRSPPLRRAPSEPQPAKGDRDASSTSHTRSVQARAETLIDVSELRLAGRAPFPIRATEDRAITVVQLDALVAYVDRHCARESWTSSNPRTPSVKLQPNTINLYDVVHWVIKPATKMDCCSYVELIATAEQVPKWFVSHWWGEPVKQFVACLRGHRRDRMLEEPCAYWVCAYANNQWNAGDEVGDDPAKSSFRRAIDKSVGTVTVLDEAAITYTRIWCSYEVFVSLTTKRGESRYLYDVYTATADLDVVGLTDGCAAVDEEDEEIAYVLKGADARQRKRNRENNFPFKLLTKGLSSEVDKADASLETDRIHILNSIAGSSDLNAPPPESHEQYDRVNQSLRGRFAITLFHPLIAERCAPGLTDQILSVMSMSRATELDFDLRLAKDKGFAVGALKSALPPGLNSPRITYQGATVDSAAALGQAIGGLQSLEELTLDLSYSDFHGDGMALGKAVGGPLHLKELSLKAIRLKEVGSGVGAGLALAIRGMQGLTKLTLDLRTSQFGAEDAAALGQDIRGLQSLEELMLCVSHNNFDGDGMALGKAIGSPPHLKNLIVMANNLVEVGSGVGAGLAGAIHSMQGLTKLGLSLIGSKVGAEGAAALGQAIGGLQNLEELTIAYEGGDEGEAELRKLKKVVMGRPGKAVTVDVDSGDQFPFGSFHLGSRHTF